MSRWEQQLASHLPLMSAAAAAAFVLRARLRPAPASGTPAPVPSGESAWGEGFHRGVFRAIGSMPGALPLLLRRGFFNTMFRLHSDPWRYESLPYEIRKRDELLRFIPSDARVVLEVGCAEGHNLRAIAKMHPRSRVIGVDVSPRAIDIARARAEAADVRIDALVTDVRSAPAFLAQQQLPTADVVVIAETLYYLGTPQRIAEDLAPLASTLRPGTTVVLLHPIRDARRLHPAALAALGAASIARHVVADPERPFVVETGRIA